MQALNGVKVVDLGTVLFAPYAAQWLGDFGADVIKVEALSGDSTRFTGPSAESGMASTFLGANRNKRSIALDIRNPRGLDVLMKLLEDADVFIHNIRPQKLKKLNIDPETIRTRFPKLIYAGLHGFGQNGPYGGQPAYDDIVQGLSGSSDLINRQTGTPRYFPTVVADKMSGIVAALAIAAALAGRDSNGLGCFIEIPMFESMVAFNLVEHFSGWHTDPPLGPMGYGRALSHSRGPFRTKNGHISVMPYTDKHWTSFFRRIGASDLLADDRYVDIASRTLNIDSLYKSLANVLLTEESDHWLALCKEEQIPAAPVRILEELVEDDHLLETGFFTHIDDKAMGRVRFPGVPVIFDGEKSQISMPPRLGQHTEEILAGIGFSEHEILSLIDSGVCRQYHATPDPSNNIRGPSDNLGT